MFIIKKLEESEWTFTFTLSTSEMFKLAMSNRGMFNQPESETPVSDVLTALAKLARGLEMPALSNEAQGPIACKHGLPPFLCTMCQAQRNRRIAA